MIDLSRTVSMEKAQKSLRSLIEDARQNRTPYVLTRFGKPQALLVSIEEYEDLLEELALLSNPAHLAAIGEARNAYRAGEGGNYEKLRSELLKRKSENA